MPKAFRYFAKLPGRAEHSPVEVEPLNEGHFAVTLESSRHVVDALALDHGAVSMLVDGDSYSVEFEEHGDEVWVLVRNQVCRLDVADERKLRMRAASAAFSVEGRQVVSAPMPGKVVKVLVQKGQAVEEGQGLVVVEAMKMENELKAPKAGVVAELTAIEGSTVENGAKLAVIE